MYRLPVCEAPIMKCSLLTLSAIAALAAARPSPPPTAAAVMGTYRLGTRQLPSPRRPGCWLEVAPVAVDSVHVQLRCTTPNDHIGGFDQRLSFRDGAATYETSQFVGRCRIAMSFADAQAVVSQEGDSSACGFGAFVNVGGTYRRISSRRPPFDLLPIETIHTGK
jgi:hypothetical protein